MGARRSVWAAAARARLRRTAGSCQWGATPQKPGGAAARNPGPEARAGAGLGPGSRAPTEVCTKERGLRVPAIGSWKARGAGQFFQLKNKAPIALVFKIAENGPRGAPHW